MGYLMPNHTKIPKVFLVSALIILMGVFTMSSLFAEDGIAIKTIRPVPSFSSAEFNAEMSAEKYFDKTGVVNMVGDKYIVVDDSVVKLKPGVKVSDALKGKYIGIRLNENGQAVKIQRINEPK